MSQATCLVVQHLFLFPSPLFMGAVFETFIDLILCNSNPNPIKKFNFVKMVHFASSVVSCVWVRQIIPMLASSVNCRSLLLLKKYFSYMAVRGWQIEWKEKEKYMKLTTKFERRCESHGTFSSKSNIYLQNQNITRGNLLQIVTTQLNCIVTDGLW